MERWGGVVVRGRFKIRQNLTIKVLSKGKAKRLFNPNKTFSWLLRKGVISPKFPKIPFLLGQYDRELNISNLITNAGFAGVASRLNGDGSEAVFNYIAVGTGTTAAAVSDTTLETEITDSGLERGTGTASRITTDVTNDTAKLTRTFTVTASKAITEAGVLNAASSGVLLARQVFAAINVVNGDSLEVIWEFDID